MSTATRLAQKAQAAISKYGEMLTLTHVSTGAYDPAASTAPATTTAVNLKGILAKDSSLSSAMTVASAPGSDVQVLRRKVTIAALDLAFVPARGDTIGPIDGQTCEVIGIDPVRYQGVPITYDLRVRA